MYKELNYARYTSFDLLVILYFAHELLPAFGYYTPSLIFLAIFAILLLMSVRLYFGNISMLFPFIFVAVLECADCIVGVKGTSLTINVYGELQTLLFLVITIKYIDDTKRMERQRLFNFITAMYILTAITSTIGLLSFPEASRLLALGSGTEMYATYTRMNIGSFDFVYEIVLLTPLFIGMLKTKKVNKLMGVFLVVLSGLFVINSQYTTALLLYLMTLTLLLPIKITSRKLVIIIIIELLCALFLPDLISNLLFTVANSTGSNLVSERLTYIAEVLSGASPTESIAAESRMIVYERALAAFRNSYGFGSWSSTGSGGHSFIFDNMGVYGYIGIFMILELLKSVFKISLKPFKNSACYGYMIWSFIMSIILMFLNPKANIFFLGSILLLYGLVMSQREEENETVVAM